MSNAQAIQGYVEVIESARNKSKLTEFEIYQLNDAVKKLSGNIPELNGYIDNTGDLLGLSSEGFSKLKKLMNDDYKKTLAEAVVSQRNAYAQAMADAETAMNQAQSALEASQREANESAGDALGNFSASSILSIAAGNKWEFFKNLKPWV